MKERKVLFKKACTYAQTPDMVSVKQLMIVGENGKKYLALRLFNERAEAVSKLDLYITEFDEDGRKISSDLLDIDVSGGAGEVFIPDQKIELEDATADCVVTVKRATYGAYVYRAEKDKIAVEYCGIKHNGNITDKSDNKEYTEKAGKDGITVKPRKLKVPFLVMLAMVVSLAATVFAVYFHMLYFVNTEKTFLYSGVEYAFDNGDSSDGTDIYVVGYYGSRARIYIPKEIEGHTVKGINKGAFQGNGSLVGVKFESELPIGDFAFENCISLKTLEFEKVTNIGVGAFKGCAMLEDVIIHAGIDEIPAEAFYGCTNLESITVEAKSEPIVIGDKAFAFCEKLNTVDFMRRISYGTGSRDYFYGSAVGSMHLANYDLSAIGNFNRFAALFGMNGSPEKINLNELVIDYLERVPEYFLQNVRLASFTVRYAENTVIERFAFDGCCELAEFSFPVSVTGVGERAFADTAITEFDGSALESMGVQAFSGCGKLASINFTGNNSLIEIGTGAFEDCESLTRITIPLGVTAVYSETFSGCSSLYDVRVSNGGVVLSIGQSAFSDCVALTAFPDLGAMPNNIGVNAFSGCTGIQDLVVPDSVENIGFGAFSGCDSIKSITLPFVGANINGSNGYLAYLFGARSYETYRVVPETLKTVYVTRATRIYDGAFNRLSGISSVVLNDGLVRIGSRAFYECTGLKSIELPSKLNEISQEAFYGCTGLESVVIPNGVGVIGLGAFSGCHSVAEISMPYAVGNGDSNNYFGYMFGATDIDKVSARVPQSLKIIEITEADVIPDRAFYGLTAVESIVLPDTLSAIGAYAFYDCRSLTELVVPKSVEKIGHGVLQYTNSLEELTVPFVGNARYGGYGSGVAVEYQMQYFYYNAESGYENYPPRALKKLTLTDSFSIAPNAFSGCIYLEQLVLDCDVQNIYSNAFLDCFKLFEIFNGSSLNIVAGQSTYGGIAEHVLAVHDGIDAEPLPQVVTSSGYRFVKSESGWYLIDYPVDEYDNVKSADLPTAVAVDGNVFDTYVIWRYLYRGTNISSIYIPSSVIGMGEYAFADCYALVAVEFDGKSSITVLPENAFVNCTMLADIVLPEGLERISDNAFMYCSRIKKIALGEKLTSIGNYAFAECKRLFEVYNYSRLNIEKGSYDNGCVALNARAVYTKEDLAENPDLALPNVISEGVQYIKLCDGDTDWWAVDYYGTDGTLKLQPFDYDGKIVDSIDIFDGAFENLYNVNKIIIGNVISDIGTQFNGCYNANEIEIVNNGGKFDKMSIRSNAFNIYMLNKVTVNVPISSIEYYAFHTNSLTSVTFSEKVDSIHSNAFTSGACNNSADIKFADIGEIEDYAFNRANGIKSFVAGDVNSIGEHAFAYCTDLISLNLGNVGEIGVNAFYNCYNLERASFNGLSDIGESAFADCSGLKRIEIKSSANMSIAAGAFTNCYSLENFEYAGTINIGNYAFDACTGLKSLSLVTVGSIGSYAFRGCDGLISVSFNGTVGTVSNSAFSSCAYLRSVRFGGNVDRIENNAFFACGSLLSAEFVGDLNTLGNFAFGSCYSLRSITLPDSLLYISDYAFSYCSALREVYLPAGLTGISQSAFSGCNMILLVYNPSKLALGDSYFDEPIAIVTDKADTAVKYVYYDGSTFAEILGKWYFISGLRYTNGYYTVPKAFTADGQTIVDFGLAKYSVQIYSNIVVVGDNVTSVSHKAFDGNAAVFYEGTAMQWQKITDGGISNSVYYKKECIHDGDDGYWRYDEYGNPTNDITVLADELWQSTVAATCVKEGEQEAYCPHCNKKFTRTVGYVDHIIVDGECTVCKSESTVLTALNMNGIDGITVQNNGFSVSDTGEIVSTNHNDNSSSVFTVKISENTDISFTYEISSEIDDYLYIQHNGSIAVKVSGQGKYSTTFRLHVGDTLVIRYEKDRSGSEWNDRATIENFTVIYTEGRNA